MTDPLLPDIDNILESFASYVATNHVIATGHGYAKRRMENDEIQAKTEQAIKSEIIRMLETLKEQKQPVLYVASEADRKVYSDKPSEAIPIEALDKLIRALGE